MEGNVQTCYSKICRKNKICCDIPSKGVVCLLFSGKISAVSHIYLEKIFSLIWNVIFTMIVIAYNSSKPVSYDRHSYCKKHSVVLYISFIQRYLATVHGNDQNMRICVKQNAHTVVLAYSFKFNLSSMYNVFRYWLIVYALVSQIYGSSIYITFNILIFTIFW